VQRNLGKRLGGECRGLISNAFEEISFRRRDAIFELLNLSCTGIRVTPKRA